MNTTELKRNLNLLRKTLTSCLIRLMLQPLKCLPVRRNRVLFSAYMEKQYACNPKYISLALQRLFGSRAEIVWAFRRPEDFAYLKQQNIRVTGSNSFEFVKLAMTSRVIVTNTYFKPSLPRRRGQFIVNTWHGGGAYKRVGKYVEMPLIERLNTRLRESGIKLFLSSGRFFTENVIRDSFGFTGEVLEKGMPRNDLLLAPRQPEKTGSIRRAIGLKDGERLVLYAPTYRRDTKNHDLGLDYKRLTRALETRFGGKWRVGYRSHHVSMYKDASFLTEGALDLTAYPDMQELLYVSDALITDYSSSIWDAALGGVKAFLYAPDLNAYLTERDFYTDIHTWPFPLGTGMEELEENILRFDEEKYARDVKEHLEALGSCETGRASEYAARRIARELGLEEKNDDQ